MYTMNTLPKGRLVPHWTSTTEEAFGERGRSGREGELWLINVINSWGWDVIDYEQDRSRQMRGHDIAIRNPDWKNFYTVDVKNNMRDDGSFMVETGKDGWLRNTRHTNDRVWHVNTRTGWMAWYDRKEMINYVRQLGVLSDGLYLVTATEGRRFITRRRYNGK